LKGKELGLCCSLVYWTISDALLLMCLLFDFLLFFAQYDAGITLASFFMEATNEYDPN